jgi:hypothetical protein
MGAKQKTKVYLLIASLQSVMVAFLLFFAGSSSTVSAAAGINSQLSFEGKIVKSDGTNITNGTYNMEFKIYQDGTNTGSGSTLKWTEDRLVGGSGGVTLTDGTFQVNLGSVNPFGSQVDWNQDTLWLSMQIGNSASCTISTTFQTNCGGDGEMTPYIRLTAVPYANQAQSANTLGGTLTAGNFVQLAQGLQTDASSTNASIAINKTGGTANILQLQKAGANVLALDNNGLLTLQPAASLIAGQTAFSQTITNASSTGGTISGYAQTITVSNTVSASTTNGHSISITDSTALANTDVGVSISLAGTNTSQKQYGVDSSVNHGIAIRGASSSGGGSETCGNITVTGAIGVCGSTSSGSPAYGGYFVNSGLSSSGYALYASNSSNITASLLDLQANTTDVFTVNNTGGVTISPMGNNVGTTIKQTSATATSGSVLDIQTANGLSHFIQVANSAANEGAVTIQSIGATRDLTLDSASGTIKIGGNSTTLQKSATAYTLDVTNASDSTLTITNSGTGIASLSVEGDVAAGSGRVFKVGATSGTTITACGASNYVSGFASVGGIVTAGSCAALPAGGSSTLAQTYTNGTAAADQTILLSSVDGGGVKIQDAATPLGTSLFAVQKNTGTVNYLNVASTGISVQSNFTGSAVNALSFDTSAATPHLKVFGSDGTNYTDIYYDTANSKGVITASAGVVEVGSGTGAVNITATGAAVNISGAAASQFTTSAGNLTLQAGSGTVTLGTSSVLTAAGALTIASTASDLSLNSGSNIVWFTTNVSSIQSNKGGTFSINLNDPGAGNTTLALTNSSAGVANLSVEGNISAATGAFQTTTNTSSAFQIQNSASSSIFAIDTIKTLTTINGGNVSALTAWQTNANGPTGTALNHSGTVTARGYIYTLGGNDGTTFYDTVQYARLNADGSTGTWASTTVMPRVLEDMTPIYANGYIYLIGGVDTATTYRQEVYFAQVNADGTLGSWNQTGNLPATNGYASAVYAPNGYIYIIGGYNGTGAKQTVWYAKPNADGTIPSWTVNATNLPAIVRFTGSAAANGYIYVTGGENGTTAQTTVWYGAYDPITGAVASWTVSANPLTGNPRYAHSLVAMNNSLYVIGGTTGSASQDTILISSIGANGANSAWSIDSNHLPAIRNYFGASPVSNGYIYVVRGSDGTNRFNTVYYSSTARLQIGGSVDLVGIAGTNAAQDNGTGGNLTAGNTTIMGTLEVRAQANFLQGGRFGSLTTSDAMVQIGSSVTDSTAVILVADSYNGASDPATVTNGGIYYNTSMNDLRCGTGGIWVNCVGGAIVTNTTSATVNTCTTTCGASNTATNAWQPNSCVAGRIFHIYASGVYGTTTTGPTISLGVYVGTNAAKASDTLIGVASNASTLAASVSALGWDADIYISCVTATTATIHGSASFLSSATTGATVTSKFYTTAAATTVPTTLSNIYIFPAFGTSNASNTITGNQMLVNIL